MLLAPREYTRERADQLFTPLAYSDEDQLYVLSDQHLGFAFIAPPLTGADDSTASKFNTVLNQDYPADSMMQVSLLATPDIEFNIAEMMRLRMLSLARDDDTSQLLNRAMRAGTDFLRNGTETPVDETSELRIRNFWNIFTVKIPIANTLPDEEERERVVKLRAQVQQSLETTGFGAIPLSAPSYIRIMHNLLHWGMDARWRKETDLYDSDALVNQQLLDFDHRISIKPGHIELGNPDKERSRRHVVCLTPKRYPKSSHLAATGRLVYDQMTGSRGIKTNFLLTVNISMPDPVALKSGKSARKTWAIQQADGKLSKYASRLTAQADSFRALFSALDEGDRCVKASMHMLVFSPSADTSAADVSNIKTYYSDLGFHLIEDVFIQRAVFQNALPFGADPQAVNDIGRYRTFATRHVVSFLPVITDWRGTRNAMLQYISRSGQLMNYDLFDSPTSYNAIIAAQSGGGKSFNCNYLIENYLSTGNADVFVIDQGRSYEKLCRTFNGQFLVFDGRTKPNMNPYRQVREYTQDADMLLGIFTAMAFPTETIKDFQSANLRRHIKAVWDAHGNEATVDHLADSLLSDGEPRIRDIGACLYPFTKDGEYGEYFTGDDFVNFDSHFVCLELQELKGRKHLQQVVLYTLILQINAHLYHSDRSRRKIILIDESWALLQEAAAEFIVQGYRTARKFGGAFVICLQSLFDAYASPAGLTIVENSPTIMLLNQKASTINNLRDQKKLDLSDGEFELMKSAHTIPGRYSEIYFLTEMGSGIARLIVDRFRQLLYTTQPNEVAAINSRIERGMSTVEAIDDLIQQEEEGIAA